MSESDDAEWCLRHATRLDEAGVPRFISETLIVQKVLRTPNALEFVTEKSCWACGISENEFQAALREAGVLEAKTDQNGGSYTTESLAISRGGSQGDYALPTDKESSQK